MGRFGIKPGNPQLEVGHQSPNSWHGTQTYIQIQTKTRLTFHVMFPLLLSESTKNNNVFRLSNIECNENPSSRSWILTCAQQTNRHIFCKFLCECHKNIALTSSKFCFSRARAHTHTHARLWHLQGHIMWVFQNPRYPLGELVHTYHIA